ncbi:hypothetical protein BD408DRAFT_447775 [Parasitella parasitica]|nr:hypothetical protein BD408DRAFT_447775 [Parasitella parasitica]
MILEGALKIEEYLECSICDASFIQPTIVGDCGHRFCLKCIERVLREEAVCPTCQKPVDSKHLRPDTTLENILVYVENLKTKLLNHSLTPLDVSLDYQRQLLMIKNHSYQQTAESQRAETEEEYQIDDSSMDELQTASNRKRPISEVDTQDTATIEDDLEREFNDGLSQTATQTVKKPKTSDTSGCDDSFRQIATTPAAQMQTTGQNHKPTSGNEKTRLLDPKNILGDIFTFSQDDESQRNGDSAMASTEGSSEGEALPSFTTATLDEPMSQSTQLATDNNEIRHIIPEIVYSDNEDENADSNMWKCTKCHYKNKPYLQTCGICRRYRNQRVAEMPPPPRITKQQPNDSAVSNKQPYQLTAAAEEEDAQVAGTLTIPNTRRRSNSAGHREVHILYTGLTPEDEKKLEKIKDEADQKLKIVIHYEMRNFDDVTHVITSVDKKHLCKRTLKYLQSVLKGKWIVEPKWLIESTKLKKWQPEEKYEVQGDHLTGKTHAPMLARKSQHQPLFQDLRFHFFGDFSGKHNKNDLLKLCRAGGAKILTRKPPARGSSVDENENVLDLQEPVVIKCSDKKKCPSWLSQCQVRDPQWVIDCISTFNVI